jgi:hypothetical protein
MGRGHLQRVTDHELADAAQESPIVGRKRHTGRPLQLRYRSLVEARLADLHVVQVGLQIPRESRKVLGQRADDWPVGLGPRPLLRLLLPHEPLERPVPSHLIAICGLIRDSKLIQYLARPPLTGQRRPVRILAPMAGLEPQEQARRGHLPQLLLVLIPPGKPNLRIGPSLHQVAQLFQVPAQVFGHACLITPARTACPAPAHG